MKQAVDCEETNFAVYENAVVPESPLLRVERSNGYGSVPGLDDSELASPDELERQVYRKEWGPVLALPARGSRSLIRPAVDEDGSVDFGAFATVDFDRYRPDKFDKARYKVDKLREEVRNLVIRFSIINEKMPQKAKYKVLKYLKLGIIELEDIDNWDMYFLGGLYLRILGLQKQIKELKESSWCRKQQQLKKFLEL